MPVLDFPIFYSNIVEPYSVKLTQQQRFNILFAEIGKDGELIERDYSSSLASRYTRGVKSLPCQFIEATCKLSTNQINLIMERLFQDPEVCKKSALELVKDSTLSSAAKKDLEKSYGTKNSYDFLSNVFVASLKCSNTLPSDISSGIDDTYSSAPFSNEYDSMYESPEFLNWLDSNHIYHNREHKAGYAIPYIKQYDLTLPQNIISLMYFAYRVCHKANILGLESLDEFYNALYMDPATMTIKTGSIKFYEISVTDLASAGSIISSADFPKSDQIILNICYDGTSHQVIRDIETAIKGKACKGAKIYKSINILDSSYSRCYVEMLLHVPQPA